VAMRRAIRVAAREGYDEIAVVRGG
jgi:hypothetical protein